MWHIVDYLLMMMLVCASILYVVYALGAMSIKRRMLELLIRCCGLKVYSLFSPRAGACSHCSADIQKRELVRQFKLAAKSVNKSSESDQA
ncbi:MAG: hypothetical protein AB7F79_07585 [Steroidobacteraceae bacterium]